MTYQDPGLGNNNQIKANSAGQNMEPRLSAKGSSVRYHSTNKCKGQFASASGTAVNCEA